MTIVSGYKSVVQTLSSHAVRQGPACPLPHMVGVLTTLGNQLQHGKNHRLKTVR